MIYLLLFLIFSICSTLPLDKGELKHGTEKLTDGVPTPSHHLANLDDKKLSQSLPSMASSLQFPEVHVTSEVRTVSLQITEDGMPIVGSIVNPVVFAREPRLDAVFEPTEVEAPVYTPTSTSVVINSSNSDKIITTRSPVYIHNGRSVFPVESNKELPIAGIIGNGNNRGETRNIDNPVIKNNSKVYNEISRKPKRISSFVNSRNISDSGFSLKDSKTVSQGEIAPGIFDGKDKTKEIHPEMTIMVRKRQQQSSGKIESGFDSTFINKSSQKQGTTTKSSNSSSVNNSDTPLIEGGIVSELRSGKINLPDQPYNESERPIVLEPREADVESFWKTSVESENIDAEQDDREFAIERIQKEGISQLLLNFKDNTVPKTSKAHSITSKNNKSAIHLSREKTSRKITEAEKDQHTIDMDLMDTTSLNEQLPAVVLESQENVLLKASNENMKLDGTISVEEDAGLITSNVSGRTGTIMPTKPGQKSDIKSSSSHMIQGVLKSRALEPYVDLFDPTPSISPNQELYSPISEQLDRDLAPGCVAAIVLGVLLCALAAMGSLAFVVYNRHSGIRPKMLSSDRSCANSDSGGYFDDQCRVAYLNSQSDVSKGTPEDLVSLDNDSFLNSLESMTIQNLWTDNIRHTKL